MLVPILVFISICLLAWVFQLLNEVSSLRIKYEITTSLAKYYEDSNILKQEAIVIRDKLLKTQDEEITILREIINLDKEINNHLNQQTNEQNNS